MKVLNPIEFQNSASGFSRASPATYVQYGSVFTVGANIPRYQDGAPFYENSAWNLCLNSENFTAWTINDPNISVVAGAGASPESVIHLSANSISWGGGIVNKAIYQTISKLVNPRQSYTFSVWLRGSGTLVLMLDNAAGEVYEKEVVLSPATGWQRYSVTGVFLNRTNVIRPIILNKTVGANGYIWGAQLEEGDAPTSYIPTTTAAVKREADLGVGKFIRNSVSSYFDKGLIKYATPNTPRFEDGKLLLEKSTVNLVKYSNRFSQWVDNNSPIISENSVVAPDGTMTADVFNGPLTRYYTINSPVLLTIGKKYTFSIFLKVSGTPLSRIYIDDGASIFLADFALSTLTVSNISPNCTAKIEQYPNGWYRMQITFTIANALINHHAYPLGGVTHAWWGAQVEEGDHATSYIPTDGCIVRRRADTVVGVYSRYGEATYLDDDGYIKVAEQHQPKIENGKVIVEESRTTDVATEDFANNTYWWKIGASITTDSTINPMGGIAQKLTESSANETHEIYNGTITGSIELGSVYTSSIFVKYGGRTRVRFVSNIGVSDVITWYDFNTKVISSSSDVISNSAVEYPNGWIRLSHTWKANATNTSNYRIYLSLADNSGNSLYLGNGSSGVYLFGAQFEKGSNASSYIVPTGYPVQRYSDTHKASVSWIDSVELTPYWSNTYSYTVGQTVAYKGRVYEALIGANVNHNPEFSPTYWLDTRPTNEAAITDKKIETKSICTGVVVYAGPDKINTVAILETTANKIHTTVFNQNSEVTYEGISGSLELDADDEYFGNLTPSLVQQSVHSGIPSTEGNAIIGVKFEKVVEGASLVGVLLTGYSVRFGQSQYGLSSGIIDYSKKSVDDFGNTTVVERPYSKKLSVDVYIPNENVNNVQRFLYDIRSKPALWVASDDVRISEATCIYGFYKDFNTTISYPDVSICNIQIEGLT